MTQEVYTIWRPEYGGHAPPNWREGMEILEFRSIGTTEWRELAILPSWGKNYEYKVPPEALTAPKEDDAAFDVAAWLEQGRANLDKLPEGVVLPNPKDWATELSEELRELYLYDQRNEAIALIRDRVVLKGEA